MNNIDKTKLADFLECDYSVFEDLKFSKSGQLNCQYTQNPNGGNGWKSLQSRLNDDWFGWKYTHFLVGHVKNVDEMFAKTLYNRILTIFKDPNSKTAKKLAANGWFGETMSQDAIHARYTEAYKNTIQLLKK